MSPRKHPPKLVLGRLSGRIYIATRYTVRDNGVIESHEKYDVTDDFMNIYADAVARFDYTPRFPSGKERGE